MEEVELTAIMGVPDDASILACKHRSDEVVWVIGNVGSILTFHLPSDTDNRPIQPHRLQIEGCKAGGVLAVLDVAFEQRDSHLRIS